MENNTQYNGHSHLATPGHLAEALKVNYGTLRQRLIRGGQPVSKSEPLPASVLVEVLDFYGKGSKEAKTIADALGVRLNKEIAPRPLLKTVKPKRWGGRKKISSVSQGTTPAPQTKGAKWFLYFVFIGAMLVQMEHTATLAHSYSALANEAMRWTSAIFFAFSFQFTALLITVRSGNINTLKWFAVVEFLINLFYYSPWGSETWERGLGTVLLGAAIPFAIYTYSELFVQTK